MNAEVPAKSETTNKRSSSIGARVRDGSVVSSGKASLHEVSSGSDISTTSFKRWHKHMQSEHLRMQRSSFTLWKCCDRGCKPCRWFDSVDYDTKICKCCLKFRTFKTWGTILFIAVYFYIFMYSILKEQVLPGGTIFFLFFLFVASYLCGFGSTLIGLPPLLGHLAIGILFANIPPSMLPYRNNETIEMLTKIAEEILLVLALIRAGLLLDLSRIKPHVAFIIQLGFFPFICEFVTVWFATHFLLELSWGWSALQGSVMSVVSLASLTTIMSKNKTSGYGEDKDLCIVLVAAAVLNVIFGLFLYTMCISYILPENGAHEPVWFIFLLLIKGWVIGLLVGGISGLLVAFFPDKRNSEAAALRIIVIGIGSFSMTNLFNELRMGAAGVLSCLTFCITATNMWEELGWHKENNPVQYFYTMAYYSGQPAVLSLLGLSMDFNGSDRKEIGLAIAVLCIGLVIREFASFLTTTSKKYQTTMKERIFICVAWFSKGTFQALLAFTIKYIVLLHSEFIDERTLEEYLDWAGMIRRTTIISILLTTPLACFILTILSPVLLTKPQTAGDSFVSDLQEHFRSARRRTSIRLGRFSFSE